MLRWGTAEVIVFIVVLQLFYSVSVTLLEYALPDKTYLYLVVEYTQAKVNATDIEQKLQSGLVKQTQIPIIDMAALVFYSGNVLIDLMINFMTAFPSMVTLLIAGVFHLLPLPAEVQASFKLFTYITLLAIYIIYIINVAVSIRTGRAFT